MKNDLIISSTMSDDDNTSTDNDQDNNSKSGGGQRQRDMDVHVAPPVRVRAPEDVENPTNRPSSLTVPHVGEVDVPAGQIMEEARAMTASVFLKLVRACAWARGLVGSWGVGDYTNICSLS